MKYIYGPLNSRRLGLSLGVNLTPYKTCSFDCVYCQLGRTTLKTEERQGYFVVAEILDEFKAWLRNNPEEANNLGYITFSGSGEPTLNQDLGVLITQIKAAVSCPVAVITNASLFTLPQVRQELINADLVIPSLDAVVPDIFKEIDRPIGELKIEDVIEGLVSFRKEFKGKIWLEIMLVKGINDSFSHIDKIKEVLERVKPDKIQLNSPVRVSAEENILPVDSKKLEEFREILGDRCEII